MNVVKKHTLMYKELVKYIISGSIVLVINVGGNNLLFKCGLAPWLSTTLSAIISVTAGYFLHIQFTFKVLPEHKSMLPKFIARIIVCFLCTQLFIWFFFFLCKLPYLQATVLTAGIVSMIGFLFAKFWVFKNCLKKNIHV